MLDGHEMTREETANTSQKETLAVQPTIVKYEILLRQKKSRNEVNF